MVGTLRRGLSTRIPSAEVGGHALAPHGTALHTTVTKTSRDVRQLLVQAERKLLDDPPGGLILIAALLALGLSLALMLWCCKLACAVYVAVREGIDSAANATVTFDQLATTTFAAAGDVEFFERGTTEHAVRVAGAGYIFLGALIH